MSARFVRQVLLPEIGAEGQRRIEAAVAAVTGPDGGYPQTSGPEDGCGDELAHEIASRYASGAGFGGLRRGDIDVAALAPAALVTHDAARQVLAGARAALAEMRRVTGERGP